MLALCILNLMSCQFHAPACFALGEKLAVFIWYEARKASEDKNLLPMPGIEPLYLGSQARIAVTAPTELALFDHVEAIWIYHSVLYNLRD